ncbi:XTP/dITP diphosphatase [Zooshikella marina]|uniref:XTP/dITP diphosphatase n=1 Tax=Zooshikella ganghwensis TaxID=202772 RepID=UPI00041C47E7|nr:XTP/dITP diphosphatase [Zooshikella ganghwensis]MBU2707821.1 XTP/dITP diphosphatase [Zooshikella ganghwensis]
MPGDIQQVVLASNNKGKLNELQHLLGSLNIKMLPQQQMGVSEVAETGLTFVENAIIKARHAAKITGLPAIADDSGLEVDALDGAPGIYSARFAGERASDADNIEKLLSELNSVPTQQRTARFQCLLVYIKHAKDPTPLICQGTWEGLILEEPRGEHGFGYDPLFFVPSEHCSAAELPAGTKNELSHRAKAMAKLLQALRKQ